MCTSGASRARARAASPRPPATAGRHARSSQLTLASREGAAPAASRGPRRGRSTVATKTSGEHQRQSRLPPCTRAAAARAGRDLNASLYFISIYESTAFSGPFSASPGPIHANPSSGRVDINGGTALVRWLVERWPCLVATRRPKTWSTAPHLGTRAKLQFEIRGVHQPTGTWTLSCKPCALTFGRTVEKIRTRLTKALLLPGTPLRISNHGSKRQSFSAGPPF